MNSLEHTGPVVLVGTEPDGGGLAAIGLYEDADAARYSVHHGEVPSGLYYSIMTPEMGQTIEPRQMMEPPQLCAVEGGEQSFEFAHSFNPEEW